MHAPNRISSVFAHRGASRTRAFGGMPTSSLRPWARTVSIPPRLQWRAHSGHVPVVDDAARRRGDADRAMMGALGTRSDSLRLRAGRGSWNSWTSQRGPASMIRRPAPPLQARPLLSIEMRASRNRHAQSDERTRAQGLILVERMTGFELATSTLARWRSSQLSRFRGSLAIFLSPRPAFLQRL